MEQDLRETGMGTIPRLPWGTHLCGFFHTKEELTDLLVPYVQAGLENNELCVWITDEPLSAIEAELAMEDALPDLNGCIREGRMEILPIGDWYLSGGSFDGTRVLTRWVEKYHQALADGYEGLRATGNCSRIAGEWWGRFADYESQINQTLGDLRMLVLCTYSLSQCSHIQMEEVIREHGISVFRGNEGWEIVRGWGDEGARRRLESHRMREELLTRNPLHPEIMGKIEDRLSRLEASLLQDRTLVAHPAVSSALEDIRRELEPWARINLDCLLGDEPNLQAIAQGLSGIHRKISGAKAVGVEVGARKVEMWVEGCHRSELCRRKEELVRPYGCLPGMITAAMIERATETPVRMDAWMAGGLCRQQFTPAWFMGLVSDLGALPMEGFVVSYKDRILHSHHPTQAAAEALSASILLKEEESKEMGRRSPTALSGANRRVIVIDHHGLFVSVCLLRGAQERRITQRVTEAIHRAMKAP